MTTENKLSSEQDQEIVKRYSNGESVSNISKDYAVDRQTISNTLKRCGVVLRTTHKLLTAEEYQRVADAYSGGHSLEEIMEEFGISKSTATRTVKKYGASRGKTGRRRSRTIIDGAFDHLTPDAAYWMGFIFTDGHINNDGYGSDHLAVNLAVADQGHLEKLLDFMGSDHAITPNVSGKGSDVVGIRIRNNAIVAALEKHGMTPHKETRFPFEQLAKSKDFWRGCIDGDGGINRPDKKAAAIYLAGHRPLLECFQKYVFSNLGFTPYISTRRTDVLTTQISGDNAKQLIRLLYTDAATVLDRKLFRARCVLEPLYQFHHREEASTDTEE